MGVEQRARAAAFRLANAVMMQNIEMARTFVVFIVDTQTPPPTLFADITKQLRVAETRAGEGQKILKLLYPWHEIEPYTKGTKGALDAKCAELAEHGAVIRARMRYIRAEGKHVAA